MFSLSKKELGFNEKFVKIESVCVCLHEQKQEEEFDIELLQQCREG